MQLRVYSTYHLELLKIQNLSFHPAIMISILPSILVTCVRSKFWKVLIYPALLDLEAHLRSSRILVPISHLSSRILYFISLGHTLDKVLTWFQCVIESCSMAPHSSTLAWKIPWVEEPGRLQSMGSQRVGHNWATSLSLFTFMHWRRKWQPIPVFLPGESQGWGSLVGCRLWGRTELDTTEAT